MMAETSENESASQDHTTRLRPIERAMRKLAEGGMSESDIAWRFRRTPGHVRRVLDMSRVRREPNDPGRQISDLRPIERVVLRAREKGTDTAETAARLRRTTRGVEQIERLAAYKLERRGA